MNLKLSKIDVSLSVPWSEHIISVKFVKSSRRSLRMLHKVYILEPEFWLFAVALQLAAVVAQKSSSRTVHYTLRWRNVFIRLTKPTLT